MSRRKQKSFTKNYQRQSQNENILSIEVTVFGSFFQMRDKKWKKRMKNYKIFEINNF